MAKREYPPYVLQVLTSEMLVDGTIPGDTIYVFPDRDSMITPINFTSARVLFTRSTGGEFIHYDHYAVKQRHVLVYLPQIDPALLPEVNTAVVGAVPVVCGFHIGPYSAAGKVMSYNKDVLSGRLPVFDVKITSNYPGAKWSELYAPFALVNGAEIQGWEMR